MPKGQKPAATRGKKNQVARKNAGGSTKNTGKVMPDPTKAAVLGKGSKIGKSFDSSLEEIRFSYDDKNATKALKIGAVAATKQQNKLDKVGSDVKKKKKKKVGK